MKTQTLPKKPYVIYDDYEMLFLDKYGCFVDLECARVFHYTEEEVKHERRFEPSCRFFLEVDEVNEDDEPVKLKPHNVAGVDGYTPKKPY